MPFKTDHLADFLARNWPQLKVLYIPNGGEEFILKNIDFQALPKLDLVFSLHLTIVPAEMMIIKTTIFQCNSHDPDLSKLKDFFVDVKDQMVPDNAHNNVDVNYDRSKDTLTIKFRQRQFTKDSISTEVDYSQIFITMGGETKRVHYEMFLQEYEITK